MKNTDQTVERLKLHFKHRSARFPTNKCKVCGEAEGYKLQKGELWFVKGCDCTGKSEPQHRQWWELAMHIDEMQQWLAEAYVSTAYKNSEDEQRQEAIAKTVNEPDYLANKPALTVGNVANVAVKVQSHKPYEYRLARKPNGALVLQGFYTWSQGSVQGGAWKDLPTVNLEE